MARIPLRPSQSPNILIAPVVYEQRYIDQLTNALRLYFAQIDNFTQNVTIPDSGLTVDRPDTRLQVGQYYFDTSLGIPIWYNGTNWVDATGTTV